MAAEAVGNSSIQESWFCWHACVNIYMSLTFTNVLDSDVESNISSRFPPVRRLYDRTIAAILCPAGKMARNAAPKLTELGIRVIGFGDSNPKLWGSTLDALPVFSPQQIQAAHREASILVATSMYDSEITELMASFGCRWVYPMPFLKHRFPDVFVSREYDAASESVTNPLNHEAINQAYELLSDDESRRAFAGKIEYLVTLEKLKLDGIRSTKPIYFDSDILRLSDNEILADAGAYIGDTLRQFLGITGGLFRGYHAFEPDPNNFAKLQAAAAADPQRVFVRQAGVASRSGKARFRTTSGADAKMVSDNDLSAELLEVVSLDDYFGNYEPPTFIKMDIEGSEPEALRGAKNLITRHQPLLAVSIYHYASDLWSIPRLIHELNPHYRLMIRHYTREIDDTVCYALPPQRQTA